MTLDWLLQSHNVKEEGTACILLPQNSNMKKPKYPVLI